MITSPSNRWLKLYSRIIQGKKESKTHFIAEGIKLIDSLKQVSEPLVLFRAPDCRVNSPDCLTIASSLWSFLDSRSKLLGIFPKPGASLPQLTLASHLLVLEGVQDPGNVGTLLRTALASGWNYIICLPGTADPFSRKVIRSSAGAITGLHIFKHFTQNTLDLFLQQNEFTVIATSSKASTDLVNYQIPKGQKTCLLLGNEGAGLSGQIKAHLSLKLAMKNNPSIESLNVGIAGSLFMYKLQNLL